MATTATPNLFEPPPKYFLPLVEGQDLAVEFMNDPNDDESYVNYDPGVTLTLEIDDTPQLVVPAIIQNASAFVKIESAVSDTIASGLPWRLILSTPTSPTTETVAAHGKTKRFDA